MYTQMRYHHSIFIDILYSYISYEVKEVIMATIFISTALTVTKKGDWITNRRLQLELPFLCNYPDPHFGNRLPIAFTDINIRNIRSNVVCDSPPDSIVIYLITFLHNDTPSMKCQNRGVSGNCFYKKIINSPKYTSLLFY